LGLKKPKGLKLFGQVLIWNPCGWGWGTQFLEPVKPNFLKEKPWVGIGVVKVLERLSLAKQGGV